MTLVPLEMGLAPGVNYYVQISPSAAQTTFRLPVQSWPETFLTYSYVRSAWNASGRIWMHQYSGIAWNSSTASWALDPSWADAATNVAQDAYTLEFAARGAVNMGAVRSDIALLDEISSFFVAYEGRYTTLGAMRAMTQYNTSLLPPSEPNSIHTLIWVVNQGGTTYVEECDLCNSQFYYPVARLLRIITTLPISQRTPAMQAFAQWYGPVLATDHLARLLARNNGQLLTDTQNIPGVLDDEALWLAAESAELLGANGNDPETVPLSASEILTLQQAVGIITQVLQTQYRTFDSGTANFKEQQVGSVSYFNGTSRYDQSDYSYSGYTGQSFPKPRDAAVQMNASWDISHAYRIPVFLRALYDNRKSTGATFPQSTEIQLVANQLLYRNFQGNSDLPLFNNFFDGSNGWYRVGYHGSDFGYPPAQYCTSYPQTGQYTTPCMTAGAVQGWGLLEFFNPDLNQLEHSLSKLAWTTDSIHAAFLKQFYYYAGQDFAATSSTGQQQYPILLYFILSNNAEELE